MQVRKKKIILITGLIIVILSGGTWVLSHSGSAGPKGIETSEQVKGYGVTEDAGDGFQRYTSEQFGFTFLIPVTHTVGEFDEGGGRVVLVNSADGSETFQLFISSFGESPESLTPERIQEDVPGLSIREPEELSMTGGQKVLTFIGEDSVFGVTREVWMVHKDHLFQIVTPISTQDALATLLESWELF